MSLNGMSRVIDASSIIHGWDNYPPEQFPGLWEWLAQEVNGKLLQIPRVAFEEVDHKLPECAKWLQDNNVEKIPVSNDILRISMQIHSLLGIFGDDYGNGVGENDIIIIATAKTLSVELISNEKRQTTLPTNLKNYKIPAVCGLHGVGVPCISFLDYLRQSGRVFR